MRRSWRSGPELMRRPYAFRTRAATRRERFLEPSTDSRCPWVASRKIAGKSTRRADIGPRYWIHHAKATPRSELLPPRSTEYRQHLRSPQHLAGCRAASRLSKSQSGLCRWPRTCHRPHTLRWPVRPRRSPDQPMSCGHDRIGTMGSGDAPGSTPRKANTSDEARVLHHVMLPNQLSDGLRNTRTSQAA